MFNTISIPLGTTYEYLGSAPYNEDCAQVETGADYLPQMRRELTAYKHQLERLFPEYKGYFKTKWERHDFGTYGEIVVYYKHGAAVTWEDVIDNIPGEWDQEALNELNQITNEQ